MVDDLQTLCAQGQEKLMATEYLQAERTLAAAEDIAWTRKDFDTLSRLYLPLQEARRQRRQRCGEGIVCLDLLARSTSEQPDPHEIVEAFPVGELLVAGWASIAPALEVRRLQREKMLYIETFLAAVYPIGASRAVAIIPTQDVQLPDARPRSIDDLVRSLPPHSIVLAESELPAGRRRGSSATYAEVMKLWERLHLPFLAAADMQIDPLRKIEGYRKTIDVDYACELAHQNASQAARQLARNELRQSD